MKRIFLTLAVSALATCAFSQTEFDAITGGSVYPFTRAGVTVNQEAEDVTLASSSSTLSSLDLNMVNNLSASYSDVQLVVQFFSSYLDTNTGSTPEFSGLLTSTTIDLGAVTTTTGLYNQFLALTLNPTAVSGNTVGVMITILSSTGGSALAAAPNLETGVNLTAPAVVGANSDANDLLWARSGGTSSTMPTGSQYVYFGSGAPSLNDNLSIRLYAAAPEPVSMGILAFGALGLLRRRRRG